MSKSIHRFSKARIIEMRQQLSDMVLEWANDTETPEAEVNARMVMFMDLLELLNLAVGDAEQSDQQLLN